MRYEAEVHGTVKGTALTYVLVRYFANDADREPTLTEEHLMQLADEGERIITNEDGHWLLADGSYLDPAKLNPVEDELVTEYEFQRETYKRDVIAEMSDSFMRRWERAVEGKQSGDWTGDATKTAYVDGKPVVQRKSVIVETDDSDPKGVLARADIESIKKPREVKTAGVRGGI